MTMIQIRNVPEGVHRQVKARAALAGMTLSDYLLLEITRLLERPTRADLLDQIGALPPIHLKTPPEEVIRAERNTG
jgi:hypothetical protein